MVVVTFTLQRGRILSPYDTNDAKMSDVQTLVNERTGWLTLVRLKRMVFCALDRQDNGYTPTLYFSRYAHMPLGEFLANCRLDSPTCINRGRRSPDH